MSYTLYDFTESLNSARRDGGTVQNDQLARVVAAWGYSTEGYGEWSGGFLIELKDGSFAYITGWCDTTGWGCQDGAETKLFESEPELDALGKPTEKGQYDNEAPGEWDRDPSDLNRWIADGCPEERAW